MVTFPDTTIQIPISAKLKANSRLYRIEATYHIQTNLGRLSLRSLHSTDLKTQRFSTIYRDCFATFAAFAAKPMRTFDDLSHLLPLLAVLAMIVV